MEQLQLRKGYIRCIQCAHIFDGFEAALPPEPQGAGGASPAVTPAVEPVLPPVSPQPPATSVTDTTPDPDEAAGPQSFYIPESDPTRVDGPTPAQPFSIGQPFVFKSSQEEPQIPSVVRQRGDMRPAPSFTISTGRAASAGHRSEPGMGADDDALHDDTQDNLEETDDYLFIEPHAQRRSDRHQPEFLASARQRRGWAASLWSVLAVCGLVLLLLQGLYVYRVQLANNFPGLRPTLEAACERIGCSVPYERRIEAIAITGSALRSSAAPENEVSSLTLEATLRNTHERPQEWPTLILDLKDASGTVVVRRNLAPEVWVPAELVDGPFAAGSEITVQLPVTVRGLQANGYQLDKFFP